MEDAGTVSSREKVIDTDPTIDRLIELLHAVQSGDGEAWNEVIGFFHNHFITLEGLQIALALANKYRQGPELPRPSAPDDAEVSGVIAKCIADIERDREQMKKDQEDIDRLKSETRAMIARLLAA